jgi:hypothetical protein
VPNRGARTADTPALEKCGTQEPFSPGPAEPAPWTRMRGEKRGLAPCSNTKAVAQAVVRSPEATRSQLSYGNSRGNHPRLMLAFRNARGIAAGLQVRRTVGEPRTAAEVYPTLTSTRRLPPGSARRPRRASEDRCSQSGRAVQRARGHRLAARPARDSLCCSRITLGPWRLVAPHRGRTRP